MYILSRLIFASELHGARGSFGMQQPPGLGCQEWDGNYKKEEQEECASPEDHTKGLNAGSKGYKHKPGGYIAGDFLNSC